MRTATLTLTRVIIAMATMTVAMEVPVTKQFSGGFQSQFCYASPNEVHNWTARLVFDHTIDSLEIYSANIVDVQQSNTIFVITNKHYNGDLSAGENLCLKFTARTDDPRMPRVIFLMQDAETEVITHDVTLPVTDSSGSQLRNTAHVLWQLLSFPSSPGHDPVSHFNPQSQGQFGDDSVSIVDDPTGLAGKVLRVFYQKGHYSQIRSHRGAQFYSRPTSARTSLTLSYDIYFSPGFDFVKGGKLPGLFGGATNCSGGRHSDLCFSTRLMWRGQGDGEVYAYIPQHQTSSLCHDSTNHCNPAYGTSLGRGSWRFQTGRWQTITQRLTLNSPGHLDGRVDIWYNDHHVLRMHDLNIRTRQDLLIEGIYFSTFFGGSDPSWAPTADCYTYYKNFVLSTGGGDVPAIVG